MQRSQPQSVAEGGSSDGGAPDSELAEASGSAGGADEAAPDPELGEPDDEDGEKSRVIFRMAHGVAFGEQLKVVGDGPVLGNWDITQAPSEHTSSWKYLSAASRSCKKFKAGWRLPLRCKQMSLEVVSASSATPLSVHLA